MVEGGGAGWVREIWLGIWEPPKTKKRWRFSLKPGKYQNGESVKNLKIEPKIWKLVPEWKSAQP